MEKRKIEMLNLFKNMSESMKALNDFMKVNEDLKSFVSFDYPFKEEDDLETVTEAVEEWSYQTELNLRLEEPYLTEVEGKPLEQWISDLNENQLQQIKEGLDKRSMESPKG